MAGTTQELAQKYKKILSESKTAYNPGSTPTASDISAQKGYMQARAAEDLAKSEKLKSELYGEDSPEGTSTQKSYLQRVLHNLGTPLYGIVGGVESLLGKGTKSGFENIKANIEEEGCYDEQTEVLTDGGWKFFKDLTYNNKIATLNPVTNFLEYQVIKLLVKYNDKKNLLVIKNRAIDIAVTENHNMWVSTLSMKNKKTFFKSYSFIKAIELPNTQIKIKRTCKWAGEENGKSVDWFAFMGIYLAEGCLSSHKKSIFLAVTKNDIKIKVRKLLQRLKFKYSERKDGNGFEVFGEEELVEEIKKLGLSYEKYIPKLIKFATTDKIKIFLEWFGYGDATYRNGWREFYSSSKRLINDLQECLIKIGENGNINVRDRRGRKNWFKNHWIINKQLSYELNERVKKTDSFICGWKDIRIEKYSGNVYCAEVDNHIMLVRRNGKAYFCGNTFGDLLRSYNMSNLVAAPLGLALDIAGDPINWATMGTAAFVPRIGYGAIKAGPAGAKAALKSGALMKAEKLGRLIPGLTKKAFVNPNLTGEVLTDATKIASKKMPSFYRDLTKKAVESRETYEKLTETGLDKVLENSVNKVRVLDRFANYLNRTPTGRSVKKMFGYDTDASLAQAAAEGLSKKTGFDIKIPTSGSPVESLLNKNAEEFVDWTKTPSKMVADNNVELASEMVKEAAVDKAQKALIQTEMKKIARDILKGDPESLAKLHGLTEDGKKRFISIYSAYKADVKVWDKAIAKSILNPYGEKVLNTYAKFIGTFKTAKISGGLPGTGVNATVGNPIMAFLKGIDITDPQYYKRVMQGWKAARGKNYDSILNSKELSNYIKTNEAEWIHLTGVYPGEVVNGRIFDRKLLDKAVEEVRKTGVKISDKELMELKSSTSGVLGEVFDTVVKKSEKEASNIVGNLLNPNRTIESSSIASEIFRGPMGTMVSGMKDKADKGSALYKGLYAYFTAPMEFYSSIDQGYKIGNLLKFVEDGVSYDELIKLAKTTAIRATDITQVPGRNAFKIKPDLAVRIANDIYMDYLAMPGFVKIMRNLPILGSPFMSFSYGMSSKVLKTAMYNPSAFNKVNFAMKEITGERSPLEKEALGKEYYEWYNRPGMLKIPFFEQNPVYLNMANMLPYYNMNIFQPAERDYKSKLGNTVAGAIDRSPFLKDPVGSLWFDYLVQPMLLQGEKPKGMFNQPLWLDSDSKARRAGRLLQGATETVLPTALGYAGVVAPWGENAEDIIPYLPVYRGRQLAFAKRGKSSWGIQTKEPALEKTARAMAAMAGLPTYQIKLQYNK